VRLIDYLDKGASLGPDSPCMSMGDTVASYGAVQGLSWQVARALHRSLVGPGAKVAILSANDPTAFACVFGISRAGAVWCPINPRNAAAENQELLDFFDCSCVIFQAAFAGLIAEIRPWLPKLTVFVCLDGDVDGAVRFADWAGIEPAEPWEVPPVDDVAMIVGTGGTTGRPKGVQLTGRNIETMSALTLMCYPFLGKPRYLALAPLTHAAGVLCFPVLALGGEIVVLPTPDLTMFLRAVQARQITHTFLPPTLIYLLLEHADLGATDLRSLQCFWYGAAPMSPSRLAAALQKIGPVMAQLFGQSEAPMMISTMAPREHFRTDGSIATERLASAGRAAPLVRLAVMAKDGTLLPQGERGEIVVRSSLVMAGYYKDAAATAEASAFGWHHTGDIGYLDAENYLFIVDRAKDMIITGGFNVYSTEVEQALLRHPAIRDCAVIGLPDDKWGERVTAVVELQSGQSIDEDEVRAFVKGLIGSVKTPKRLYVWGELPRSKVGKVLKAEVKDQLTAQQ
jgi:acyl-CoA synthetase (AMP-forming)/AMP-acid ligase II